MHPSFKYASLDELAGLTSERVVCRDLLLARASADPDAQLVRFEDARTWTAAEALAEACHAATALRAAGVERGDAVALLLPNGPDFLRVWWGAALLGAPILPLNPALRGALLEGPLALGQPRVLVVADDFRPRVDDISIGSRTRVLSPDDVRAEGPASVPTLDKPIGLWDVEKLLMTSGTTGPSKLVQATYLMSYWGYTALLKDYGFGADDVFQIDLPLFHAAAGGYVTGCLATGSGMSVRARPALDDYWVTAKEAGVTGSIAISSMITALLQAPPSREDREHKIRLMVTAPIPPQVEEFKARFGVVDVVTSLGSTEMSCPLLGEADSESPANYCGVVRPGWEVRLVDENDQEVPRGEVGQAVVRGARAGLVTPGYVDNVEATASAWRNGWFHSGDLLRQDDSGAFYFVDRAKDVIRRRGENISAYEVELALTQHPDVAEAACVPVPSDTGFEDDVKAWLVLAEGCVADMKSLLDHCVKMLPHYMVPRYFETIDAIPKTPTAKAQKYVLRANGNSDGTWDAIAHGFRVTRRGLERIDV